MSSTIRRLLAAIGLTAASASTAGAAIIYYSGPAIPIPTTYAGVSVDLETFATTNDLAGAPGMDVNFFLGGEGISNDADETASMPTFQPVRTGTGNSYPVDNLTIGTTITAANTYASPADFGGSGTHFLPFVNGESGYIGFSVVLADTTLAYGWMRVTLQNDNTPGVIHEWAYQDSGGQIQVGQTIPEPSHALLTCLGLAALALRRRR
jgi:hypothetical protein